MPGEPSDIKLLIEVKGEDRIVVTMPGSHYRATFLLALRYIKLLLFKRIREDFEQLAFEAARAKARELGWIV
jgi:hypothetical protein